MTESNAGEAMSSVGKFVPILDQFKAYNKHKFSRDLVAAIVVTIMLIPQSLAYAMLAGVPPELGLYASILPLLAYSLFGSCTTLAVGPVAIASLMTASTLGVVTQQGIIGYIDGAILLALMSGFFLMLLGVLRLGFLSHFLSHSVVAGFITASGILIALSQVKHILGVDASGHNFVELLISTIKSAAYLNEYTILLGVASLIYLFWARKGAVKLLTKLGVQVQNAEVLSKTAPVIGVIATTLIVAVYSLDTREVSIVGNIPFGMPSFLVPTVTFEAVQALIIPAVLISIIGYVETVSVGKTLSAKKREKIDGNQELIGLGAANLASGISGAFPVTGGFARSVVNFDAGAETQFAGVFTAIGILLAALFLTPYLYYLPIAMLAATIIVAVLSIVDFTIFRKAWKFSKTDFAAVLITVVLTLFFGVETGVASGIFTSILLHLYHTSEPHIAEIGLIKGTEHFRNVNHFSVVCEPGIASLRIDESLLFSNAGYLEDYIDNLVEKQPEVKNVILHCGAINTIDLSALEMLESLNLRLREKSISLHLAELKIPVKSQLDRVNFIERMSGELFLSQFEAQQSVSKKHATTGRLK